MMNDSVLLEFLCDAIVRACYFGYASYVRDTWVMLMNDRVRIKLLCDVNVCVCYTVTNYMHTSCKSGKV